MCNRKSLLDNITICIPVRIDSDERLGNLYSVVDHFAKNGISKIIIYESDDASKLLFDESAHAVKHVFIKDDAIRFHRTKIINAMLKKCDTPFAAVWDADVIVPITNFIAAAEIISKGEATIVYPYDGRLWDIKEYFSHIFRQYREFEVFTKFACQIDLLNGYESVGGGFLVNISKYREAGLENEHFIGWGPEDEERFCRLFILGHKVERINGVMYHLHHSRGVNSSNMDKEMSLITKREFAKVCAMNKSDLENYIKTWSWTYKL